jgi:hypothetical protein
MLEAMMALTAHTSERISNKEDVSVISGANVSIAAES